MFRRSEDNRSQFDLKNYEENKVLSDQERFNRNSWKISDRSRDRDRKSISEHSRSRSTGRNTLEQDRRYDRYNRFNGKFDRCHERSNNLEKERNRKWDDKNYNRFDDRSRDWNYRSRRDFRYDRSW